MRMSLPCYSVDFDDIIFTLTPKTLKSWFKGVGFLWYWWLYKTKVRMVFSWHSVYVDDIIITFNHKNMILRSWFSWQSYMHVIQMRMSLPCCSVDFHDIIITLCPKTLKTWFLGELVFSITVSARDRDENVVTVLFGRLWWHHHQAHPRKP